MKKAVLLGTSHPIQRGENQKDDFRLHIEELCNTHGINAVAEEIDNKCISVAADITVDFGIAHKIIEPTPEERKELGIEEVHRIIYELINRHNIDKWPDEPSVANLPDNVYEEYTERTQTTYRQRESEWLRRINVLDAWPVLIICGADHYQPFYELLSEEGIDVVKESCEWGICQDT